MSEVGIILGSIVIVAVAMLDIIVRLVVAPRRRDKCVESLLDSRTEVEPADQTARHELAALTSRTGGMPPSEVLAAGKRQLAHLRERELPAAAGQKIVMPLMGADLAALRKGGPELAPAGQRLHALLQARPTGLTPTPAFVSP